MQDIITNLDVLRQFSGNGQIEFLNMVKSPLLREILEYTYDTHKKYKIDELKYDKFAASYNCDLACVLDIDYWNKFKAFLDYLASIPSAKDVDVEKAVHWIQGCDKPEFLKMVLFKDLRLNMNVKKMQKVFAGFLEEPQVQLAMALEDRKIFDDPYYSRKFDGKRVYIMDDVPYSRANKECYIPPMQHILDQLKEQNINDYVLDGECLYFENGVEDFQKGISLCQKKDRTNGCENICYVIFDILPKENFKEKKCWKKFKEEYEFITTRFADFDKETPCHSLIGTAMPNVYIARQDKDDSILGPLSIEKKFEGLMVRDGNSPYEFKRTNKLLKIKKMHDTEVKLMGMEEGTGKHEGRLGSFHVDYKGFDLKIGSGFTDEQREKYWNNRDSYIGKYVKVQYFEETVNQDGEESLRFPIFLCFRNIETNEEFV